MDDNKLHKLREIGYTIRKCCGTCLHATFKGNSSWGTCGIFTYDHKKHTGGGKSSTRALSISTYGSCKSFEIEPFEEVNLDHYKEFHE